MTLTCQQSVIISVVGVPGALVAGYMVEIPVLGRRGTLAISTGEIFFCLNFWLVMTCEKLSQAYSCSYLLLRALQLHSWAGTALTLSQAISCMVYYTPSPQSCSLRSTGEREMHSWPPLIEYSASWYAFVYPFPLDLQLTCCGICCPVSYHCALCRCNDPSPYIHLRGPVYCSWHLVHSLTF
jgi:hypothetical protein